jgi:isocitrate/isopropylmalate dehydrogenase
LKTYQIDGLPGDGIGPECLAATQIVLDLLAADAVLLSAIGLPDVR